MGILMNYRPLLLALSLAACSRAADQSRKADSARADSAAKAMADMPGMAATAPGETTKPPGDSGTARSSREVLLTREQIQHGKVRWAPAATGFAKDLAVVPGQLVPNEDRSARLGAPAGGRVLTVHVRPGDRVAAGQALVTMQSPEAGAAQSDVAKATAEVTSRRAQSAYARSARERAQRLLDLKAIPRQDYERAVADDELAQSALTQAQAELRRALSTAEQLGAEIGAEAVSGHLVLRSPLAGAVLERTAMPGAVVEAGMPLIVIADPSSLWLSISAPEKMAALFHRGATLRFAVPAFPADTFAARVDAVAAGLSPDTRTLAVRAAVSGSAGKLKPQMLASVFVEGNATIPAVVVPEGAVQLLDGKSVVFIAIPDGKGGARFVAREVVAGSRGAGQAAITTGLSPGDLVVIEGALAVKAQLKKGGMPMVM
jgi:cobalt-zinc-cadmium efflux system membrane fusion protein